jgi:hypothetical protein
LGQHKKPYSFIKYMIIYTVTVDDTGTKHWYLNDKRHRTDGPAAEYADGTKLWYQDGKCHRTDGPAYEDADGSKHWYLDGKELTQAQWKQAVKPKPSCVGKIVEVDGVKYKLVAA